MNANHNAPELPPTSAPPLAEPLYWRRTRHLTLILLAIWLISTVGIVFFARELSNVRVFGWKLSFYMAAQGSVLINLAIVVFYAWRMGKLDQQYLMHSPAPSLQQSDDVHKFLEPMQ